MKQDLLNTKTPDSTSQFGADLSSLVTVKGNSLITSTFVVESQNVAISPAGNGSNMKREPAGFVPLESETRFAVGTEVAAFHCNRRPQTLRTWACYENGPMRPVNVNGRLSWPVSEIRRVLCCPAPSQTKKRPEGL
jgi:hypothetical protein